MQCRRHHVVVAAVPWARHDLNSVASRRPGHPVRRRRARRPPRLRQSVSELVDDGVAGLFPCGSTGEFLALSTYERKAVLETVVDDVDGRAQVVPHTGANSVREAVELTRHAEGLGLPRPCWSAPTTSSSASPSCAYHRCVAAQSDLEIVIYHNPAGTGVNLSAAYVAELAEASPTIRYVKDSAADYAGWSTCSPPSRAACTSTAPDSLLLPALQLGCIGAVLGSANFLARELAPPRPPP